VRIGWKATVDDDSRPRHFETDSDQKCTHDKRIGRYRTEQHDTEHRLDLIHDLMPSGMTNANFKKSVASIQPAMSGRRMNAVMPGAIE
jgi:hypothetical protein